ncbi:MAG: hypothetical protein DI533_19870 [Cereibacter sphaeroides]|uniref:Uncharacterized protein n=1 Tax=Cereibacter sphaeroides TaxID=1063 RepID=A0A2W5RXJ7_CERSP|nr:MAG: hypothetical protein DI533_19870 [Cereibacter sphaeroides]
MTSTEAPALERTIPPSELDIGTPVEWMVDPDRPETILGVTYEFSLTGERKTVWYTPSKRRAKKALVLSELTQA